MEVFQASIHCSCFHNPPTPCREFSYGKQKQCLHESTLSNLNSEPLTSASVTHLMVSTISRASSHVSCRKEEWEKREGRGEGGEGERRDGKREREEGGKVRGRKGGERESDLVCQS